MVGDRFLHDTRRPTAIARHEPRHTAVGLTFPLPTYVRTVYVVTHPESTHHVDHLVGGWYDSALTPAGLRDAEAIAAAVRARIPADAEVELYSSDLRRTAQTAGALAARLGVVATLDDRLREKSYGEAGGRPQRWLDDRFRPPPPVGDRMNHDEGIPGAETKAALAHRIYTVMDDILTSDCRHQVIVTHGGALTFVLTSWIRMPLESAGYAHFHATPGGITELREDPYFHNRRIHTLDDTRHLAPR